MRLLPRDGLGARVLATRAGIERLTGEMPPVCPWRAYSDPVVSAGLSLRRSWSSGACDIDQQIAVVVDAMLLIDSTHGHVDDADRRAEREKREAEQRIAQAAQAARKG